MSARQALGHNLGRNYSLNRFWFFSSLLRERGFHILIFIIYFEIFLRIKRTDRYVIEQRPQIPNCRIYMVGTYVHYTFLSASLCIWVFSDLNVQGKCFQYLLENFTKFQTIFGFHQLPLAFSFHFRIHIQDPTLQITHLISLDASGLSPFLSLCLSWPWQFWRLLGRYCVLQPSVGTCLTFFSQLIWDDWFWRGNHGGKVSLSHHIKSTCSQHDHWWCQPWLSG